MRAARAAPWVALTLLILLAAGVFVEIRDEGMRVGACAREATALSRVSEVVREALYPDTDHFLGNLPRLNEDAYRRSLSNAYMSAQRAAFRCRGFLLRTSASEAREMYLAALEEKNLAENPRGNWISYMSETTKAKTQFELAKARYELDRPTTISGDGQAKVDKAVARALRPLGEEAAAQRSRLETVTKETAEREARRAVEEQKTAARERGPDREVLSSDFDWTWREDSDQPSIKASGFGKELRTRRTNVFSFKNKTPWRMYWVTVTFAGHRERSSEIMVLKPGEGNEFKVELNAFAQGPPDPTFSGTFTTAYLPKGSSSSASSDRDPSPIGRDPSRPPARPSNRVEVTKTDFLAAHVPDARALSTFGVFLDQPLEEARAVCLEAGLSWNPSLSGNDSAEVRDAKSQALMTVWYSGRSVTKIAWLAGLRTYLLGRPGELFRPEIADSDSRLRFELLGHEKATRRRTILDGAAEVTSFIYDERGLQVNSIVSKKLGRIIAVFLFSPGHPPDE